VFTNNIEFLGNSQIAGNTTTGYTNTYPDGTTEIYSFMVVTTNGFMKAFLTARANPEGQQTRFYYTKSNDTNSPVIRLKSVVDGDGLTNIISYVASNPYSTNLISQVTDPFNRTVTFLYDTTGHLTNITDVGGISSSFVYDNNDWVTNLTTPYGATSFKISDVRQSPSTRVPNGRVIQITESDGGKELYLFTNNAPGLATNYSQIPSLSPYTGTTLDNTSMDVNNSFHWNKLQYANLSSSFQMSGNVSQLTSNDFFRGRMRHWLRTGSGTNSVSQILSMQREASPNGTTEGQKTWYDYAGKTNTEYIGTQSEALFVARFLPNGNTNFTRILRNGCVTVE
jgi:YD repeat-containing protein